MPLEEGERPRAVTVAAVVAAITAVTNVAYAAGIGVGGERRILGPLAFSVLLLVAAWGMWRVRYWAVLGMQAILGLSILTVALVVLLSASLLEGVLLTIGVLAPTTTLFWFLVKAMARIQMPSRS